MGLLDRIFAIRDAESRATLSSPTTWLRDAWGGSLSYSGTSVSEEGSLAHPAVLRAVNLLSQTIAQLPLKVYRRLPNGGKVPEIAHRLYPLLHDSPNGEMTSFAFREKLQTDLCLYGNAFAQVLRDRQGRTTALYPLHSSNMRIKRDRESRLVYEYLVGGEVYEFPYE